MRKKLMIAIPVLLVLLFVGYSMAKPKPVDHSKVKGTIYLLPESFLLNLNDGRYAKFSVALLLAPGQSPGAPASGGGNSDSAGSGTTLGTLPEEALIRDIISNIVTGQSSGVLISADGRAKIKAQILAAIKKQTDVKVTDILFPDVAVQ